MDTPEADVRQAEATDSTEQTGQAPSLSPFSPAWEREGPSLKTAAITIWQVLRHPARTFSAPGSVSRKPATTFGVLLGTFVLTLGLLDAAPFHDQIAINYLIIALCLVMIPFFAWGLLYLDAGIIQLFLDITKSGARRFNRTYRVVAFAGGSLGIFTAVPLLGELTGFALGVWLVPYALAKAHGVAKWKTFLAFLAMYLVMALLVLVFIIS